MKLLCMFGEVIEISNLERIIKNDATPIIEVSTKVGGKNKTFKIFYSFPIVKLVELIHEAESKYSNYLIKIDKKEDHSDYSFECSITGNQI